MWLEHKSNFKRIKIQLKNEFGQIPKKLKLTIVLEGVFKLWFWSEFMDYSNSHVELIGAEAGGPKK